MPHPDEKVAVAQERVSKLEAALRAVGEDDDTAPNLREALKRARQQAVPLSIPDKVAQCESFLERARKRESAARELLLQAQTELTRLSAEVVEGEQRLATLRAELERSQSPVVTVDMSAEVQRLRALVEQLSKEKDEVHLQTDPNPKRVCRRDDFVPQCEEEMQEWIQGRQRDLQAAIVAGNLSEVARISQLMSSAAQEWQRILSCPLFTSERAVPPHFKEARSNGVLAHDSVMETRTWTFVLLLACLLLRRPFGEQRVSKAEEI